MRYEFVATRRNGKEGATLYMLYAQVADEKPLDFDIYGFRIRYVPERTCKTECYDSGYDALAEIEYGLPSWELSCGHSAYGNIEPNYCPECGAKVVE